MRASDDKLVNLGMAVAASMPNTIMTMTSSINVKPCCLFIALALIYNGGMLTAQSSAVNIDSVDDKKGGGCVGYVMV
ncbi:hypothetical protein FMO003_34020 [Moritella sp. F3]|nr:hypothetical protein FMO001_24640 [Moritella sp. F1]GIC83122.1 hypothetical protein FMO003_34020 [Moritella sp. F3]